MADPRMEDPRRSGVQSPALRRPVMSSTQNASPTVTRTAQRHTDVEPPGAPAPAQRHVSRRPHAPMSDNEWQAHVESFRSEVQRSRITPQAILNRILVATRAPTNAARVADLETLLRRSQAYHHHNNGLLENSAAELNENNPPGSHLDEVVRQAEDDARLFSELANESSSSSSTSSRSSNETREDDPQENQPQMSPRSMERQLRLNVRENYLALPAWPPAPAVPAVPPVPPVPPAPPDSSSTEEDQDHALRVAHDILITVHETMSRLPTDVAQRVAMLLRTRLSSTVLSGAASRLDPPINHIYDDMLRELRNLAPPVQDNTPSNNAQASPASEPETRRRLFELSPLTGLPIVRFERDISLDVARDDRIPGLPEVLSNWRSFRTEIPLRSPQQLLPTETQSETEKTRAGICKLIDAMEEANGLFPDLLPPPPEFFCPLSLLAMHDPVVAADENTYENEWAKRHFVANGPTSPITRVPMYSMALTRSTAMRSMMETWASTTVDALLKEDHKLSDKNKSTFLERLEAGEDMVKQRLLKRAID